ncbi:MULTISPECIES: hypothetical protein [Stutzerimonas stutzeri subgroup]|uniref:hypothetical protein n=1 Tax=Stutzerimonas stutzeri subgroup TaxID=578833 RepID=UPI002897E1AF|nr:MULTISPECIES: hypothetical protein [Stutzerimonas stutzeri subgroup]
MNSIHDHPAYKEGKESYFSNKRRYENRYPLGSTEYDAFERGWSQSLKKTPDLLLKASNFKGMHGERRECRGQSDIDIDIDIDIAKEKYLKGKGY